MGEEELRRHEALMAEAADLEAQHAREAQHVQQGSPDKCFFAGVMGVQRGFADTQFTGQFACAYGPNAACLKSANCLAP